MRKLSSKCCKIDISNSKWCSRRTSSVIKNLFDGRSIYREPIYPTAHPGERSQAKVSSLLLLVIGYSLMPHEDFRGELFSQMDEQRTPRADVIGRFRCDARLMREAVEIDSVGGRLVETSKDSRALPSPRDTLWPPQTLPFILHENKSEKEDRLPWEM